MRHSICPMLASCGVLLVALGTPLNANPPPPPAPAHPSVSTTAGQNAPPLPRAKFQSVPTLPVANPAAHGIQPPLPPPMPKFTVGEPSQNDVNLRRTNALLLSGIIEVLTNHPDFGLTPAQYLASPREKSAITPRQQFLWRTECLSNLTAIYPNPASPHSK